MPGERRLITRGVVPGLHHPVVNRVGGIETHRGFGSRRAAAGFWAGGRIDAGGDAVSERVLGDGDVPRGIHAVELNHAGGAAHGAHALPQTRHRGTAYGSGCANSACCRGVHWSIKN